MFSVKQDLFVQFYKGTIQVTDINLWHGLKVQGRSRRNVIFCSLNFIFRPILMNCISYECLERALCLEKN